MSSAAVVELQNLSLAIQVVEGPLMFLAPIPPLSVSLQVETSQQIEVPEDEDIEDEDIYARVQQRISIDDVLARRELMVGDRWSSPSQMNMQHVDLQRLDFDNSSPRGRMIASF